MQNTFENVSRYLLSKFVAVHKESSPIAGRELFTHMTAVTDIETTKVLIGNGMCPQPAPVSRT